MPCSAHIEVLIMIYTKCLLSDYSLCSLPAEHSLFVDEPAIKGLAMGQHWVVWVWLGWLPWSEENWRRGQIFDEKSEGWNLLVCYQREIL